MSNGRKNERNQSYAKLLINNSLPAYIRDVSEGGFRVYSPVPLPFDENDSISCRIIPEDGGDSFVIQGDIRWNRRESDGDDIMGILISSYESDEGKNLYKNLVSRFSKENG